MSIAQGQQLASLQKAVQEIAYQCAIQQKLIQQLAARIAALENRPKPGRPPKNG